MSGFFNALVSADDSCGPANPVASLVKGVHGEGSQLGRDRFVPLSSASSSSAASSSGFRTLPLHPSELQADAQARAFFQQAGQQQHGPASSTPFDLARLQNALPAVGPPVPAWANDFIKADPNSRSHSPAAAASNAQLHQSWQFGFQSQRAWEKSRHVDRHGPSTSSVEGVPAWAADFAREQAVADRTRIGTPPAELRQNHSASPFQQHQHQPYSQFGPSILVTPGFQQGPVIPFMQQQQQQNFAYQTPLSAFTASDHLNLNYEQLHQEPRIQEIDQKHSDHSASNWETAFLHHLENEPPAFDEAATDQQHPQQHAHESITARPISPTQMPQGPEQDLLAKTAGELLSNVSHDMSTNQKMRESSFMQLMRKLRDKEVTVQGDQMVETGQTVVNGDVQAQQASEPQASRNVPIMFSQSGPQPVCVRPQAGVSEHEQLLDSKLQGQPADSLPLDALEDMYAEMNSVYDSEDTQRRLRAFQGDGGTQILDDDIQEDQHDLQQRLRADAAVPGASSAWEEDFDFDNQLLRSGPAPPTVEQLRQQNAQQAEWSFMQDQYDAIEATSSGLRQASTSASAQHSSKVAEYPFHSRNPYLLNRQHAQHLPSNTLLAREAEVQSNPHSPQAWLNLGLKQQENERESLAIRALQRALELDGSLTGAYLALAVSFTNDNMRLKAYDSLDKWVECKTEYADIVSAYRTQNSLENAWSTNERHVYLSNLLVEMARAGNRMGQEAIDADVQIALGVLFNASEDYEKAGDCFMAALSVRPEDPHLYNRLGATLANSGKSESAIEYYYRALELQPDFARATFNLAIACMNLSNYGEAAEHLLRALEIQQEQSSDADVGEPSLVHMTEREAVESSTLLWDTLATCCNSLGRPELAAACASRNLSVFADVELV